MSYIKYGVIRIIHDMQVQGLPVSSSHSALIYPDGRRACVLYQPPQSNDFFTFTLYEGQFVIEKEVASESKLNSTNVSDLFGERISKMQVEFK